MLVQKLKFVIKKEQLYSRIISTSCIQKSNLTLSGNIAHNNCKKLIINNNRNNNGFLLLKNKKLVSINKYFSSSTVDDENDVNEEECDDDFVGRYDSMTENAYAHSILFNQEKYSYLLLPKIVPDKNISKNDVDKILSKNIDDCNPSEILDDFKIICQYLKLNLEKLSDQHVPILNSLKKFVNDYSNDELFSLLLHIELLYPMIIKLKQPNLAELENEIDKEFCLRFNDLTIDEKLKACNLWFYLRKSRYSLFVSRVMKKLGLKPYKLSVNNYIVYMFLINVSRLPGINMYELEYALEGLIDDYSTEELGIIAMAFFKTKTPIRNPKLLNRMLEKCIEGLNEMGDISITAIMKVSRLSAGLSDISTLRKLIQAFESRIENSSSIALIHTAHVASSILINEKQVIDKILQRIAHFIPELRAKDLERLLLILVIFNYPKESPYYDLIINELRKPDRAMEFKKFYKTVSTSLMYLAHVNIYPMDLLKKIFDPEYLKETYQNNAYKIGRDYLSLDSSIQIDMPDYDGPLLPTSTRNYLKRRYSANILNSENPEIKVQNYQKFTFEVINSLKEILGSKNFLIEQLLPHHQKAEIIFCRDPDNNYIPPKQYFPAYELGSIKYAPKEPKDHKWMALVLATANHVFRDSTDTAGSFSFKLRHLEKIGYTPIPILYSTWFKLGFETKKKYLQTLLSERSAYQRASMIS